jgi:hypothetical protein
MGVGIGLSGIFRVNGAPPVVAPINLFTQNLILAENRTHDLNGNSVTFLKSKFEFRASDNSLSTTGFAYRDVTNNLNLFEIRNNGRLYQNGAVTEYILNASSYSEFYLNGGGASWQLFNGGVNYLGIRQNSNAFLFQRGSSGAGETHSFISGTTGSWNIGLNWAALTANLNIGMTTLDQARLGVQASDGNGANKTIAVRNHLNTGDLFSFFNDGKFQQNGSTTTGDFSIRSRTNTATDIGMYLEQNGSKAVWYNDYNGNQWQTGKLELNASNVVSDDIIKLGYSGNYKIGIIGSSLGATSAASIVMKAGNANISTLQKFIIRNYLNQDRFVYDNETASLQLSALDGSGSNKTIAVRNHLNTGDLMSVANDGLGRIAGGWLVNNLGQIAFGSEIGLVNKIYNSFGAFFIRGDRNLNLIGSGGNYLAYSELDGTNFLLRCNSAPASDGVFQNSFINFSIDEATNTLTFKIKKSDGSFVTKTL